MNKILLVDDERWVRKALKWTIEKTDLPFVVVQECANGQDALHWLKTNEADLVLTDIRMPLMDGLALAKEIRRQGPRPDVMIISVHDDFELIREGLRMGVFDYLLKPVEISDMKASLEKWTAQRKQSTPFSPSTDVHYTSAIKKVLEYIRETPLSEVSLVEAARKVHLNPSYLSQLFKQQMAANFVDYVMELRIEEAKRLLATTDLLISEIANRLEYSDLTYFSHTFKKIAGIKPSEYRKQLQREKGTR